MINLAAAVTVIVTLVVAGLIFWLSYMRPRLAIKNAAYLGNADVKFVGNFLLGGVSNRVAIPNVADQIVR